MGRYTNVFVLTFYTFARARDTCKKLHQNLYRGFAPGPYSSSPETQVWTQARGAVPASHIAVE